MIERREGNNEFLRGETISKFGLFAQELARWDNRIVEILAMKDLNQHGEEKLDLVCTFNPEPESDTVGFFWTVNLLTRMEFEALDERLGINEPFEMAFKIGQQVFLPNGKILNTIENPIVLWPEHAE
jgi:hypothetical protein